MTLKADLTLMTRCKTRRRPICVVLYFCFGELLTEVEGGVGPLRAPQNFKLPSKFRHLMG